MKFLATFITASALFAAGISAVPLSTEVLERSTDERGIISVRTTPKTGTGSGTAKKKPAPAAPAVPAAAVPAAAVPAAAVPAAAVPAAAVPAGAASGGGTKGSSTSKTKTPGKADPTTGKPGNSQQDTPDPGPGSSGSNTNTPLNLGPVIGDWMEKTKDKLVNGLTTKGGWEGWAQYELEIAFKEAFKITQPTIRETKYQGNSQIADFDFQNMLIELKCENNFSKKGMGIKNAMDEDIAKLKKLKPSLPKQTLMALAFTFSKEGEAAVAGIDGVQELKGASVELPDSKGTMKVYSYTVIDDKQTQKTDGTTTETTTGATTKTTAGTTKGKGPAGAA